MLARCRRSAANQLFLGRDAIASGIACLRESAAWPVDISLLLLLQQYVSGYEEADREGRHHERVEPEVGIAESLGERADADRLKPGRRKCQADRPSRAG